MPIGHDTVKKDLDVPMKGPPGRMPARKCRARLVRRSLWRVDSGALCCASIGAAHPRAGSRSLARLGAGSRCEISESWLLSRTQYEVSPPVHGAADRARMIGQVDRSQGSGHRAS
jgi:hypothetical protein